MSAHREVIVIFPIYGQFVAIWKPGFARKVFNIHILINSNILSFKSWKQDFKGVLVLKGISSETTYAFVLV